MSDKQQLKLALAALAAGLAWGYLRHRRGGHSTSLALLQGLEWFIAYGGAVAVITRIRDRLEGADAEPGERITHFRQVVTEPTGTEG